MNAERRTPNAERRTQVWRWAFGVSRLAFLGFVIAACGPREPRKPELRMISENYLFTILPSQAPPHAREAVLYKVFIRDRKNRQPIETGEGQIYASSADRANTWDGFAKGAEVGTYYGKLNFVTAGTWAVAIRFRRDSLHPLERVEWMQDVLNERNAAVP
jgi:hypothetical protein